ncbi:glucose-1-phosphate cytidylyltransferase [Candidatus Roizmanbacteria bacterium]|nr:glucose-1-phosphate cytidylyltransferase [Candidatus Roizmanbacteria bacterium]
MKVVILCGGLGIRLRNQLNYSPKGMVYIDDKPLLWHIMKRYSLFGFNEFVLALGKDGEVIRDYFLNYNLNTNNIGFTIRNPKNIHYYNQSQEENWNIIFVNTGEDAHTGARLSRCEKYIDGEAFMFHYSDCLSDVNFDKLLKLHKKRKKVATITGVLPPFRYGEFVIRGEKIIDYSPTSKLTSIRGYVNGGFAVFNKKIFKYLTTYNESTLENEVYKELVKKKELEVYKHNAFWQCLDNDREFEYLKKLCQENKRYWLQKGS